MIEINNLTVVGIKEKELKNIIKKVLREENIKGKTELSIALVGATRIRKINKKYLGKNRVTDVLAFPEFKKNKTFPTGKTRNLGEIIVCLAEVKRNSKRFKSTFKKEMKRVLIHGVLHLLGYNHEKNKKEAEKMIKKQNYYFSKTLNP